MSCQAANRSFISGACPCLQSRKLSFYQTHPTPVPITTTPPQTPNTHSKIPNTHVMSCHVVDISFIRQWNSALLAVPQTFLFPNTPHTSPNYNYAPPNTKHPLQNTKYTCHVSSCGGYIVYQTMELGLACSLANFALPKKETWGKRCSFQPSKFLFFSDLNKKWTKANQNLWLPSLTKRKKVWEK